MTPINDIGTQQAEYTENTKLKIERLLNYVSEYMRIVAVIVVMYYVWYSWEYPDVVQYWWYYWREHIRLCSIL